MMTAGIEVAIMATATTEAIRLPPALRLPKAVQGVAFLTARRRLVDAMARRHGNMFTLDLPGFGRTVVVGEPNLINDLFGASRDLLGRSRLNLGKVFGPGSLFNLNGDEHLSRRRLLAPPFHSKHVAQHRLIFEEEVLRETANWPEGQEFETLPAMTRIVLRGLLRAMLGADGPAVDELSALLPSAVSLGARIGLLPALVRKDYGAWSPGARLLRYRSEFDAAVFAMMATARADPAFAERTDLLTILLQARYDNGEAMPDAYIADELLGLLAAGYETTAASLAWAVERLRRSPDLLSQLTAEADAGGSQWRQATIWEVQRARPVGDIVQRRAMTRIRLGDWVIPEGTTLMINVRLAHASEANFPEPDSFDPGRFIGASHKPVGWIPFGGGFQRCIGATYANMAMDVTLRTMLREFRLVPTGAPGERAHDHGVVFAPGLSGLAVVYRRTAAAERQPQTEPA
ncbi:cytochrome P450 [Mycobacterium sp. NPDC051804]|uniref:cytochrome P450 n=1 Tax=Mycobacterium sp. NPDC051804 TaxID=3364295 RepID=UPI0037A49028